MNRKLDAALSYIFRLIFGTALVVWLISFGYRESVELINAAQKSHLESLPREEVFDYLLIAPRDVDPDAPGIQVWVGERPLMDSIRNDFLSIARYDFNDPLYCDTTGEGTFPRYSPATTESGARGPSDGYITSGGWPLKLQLVPDREMECCIKSTITATLKYGVQKIQHFNHDCRLTFEFIDRLK